MSGEELEIEITATGKVTFRTVGIKGPRCVDVAEAFARVIGTEVDRELTAEYYETEQQVTQRQNIHERYR